MKRKKPLWELLIKIWIKDEVGWLEYAPELRLDF
jgi:hypothetical protein